MTISKLATILTPVEFEAFTLVSKSLIEEYRKSSKLTLELLVPILGNPPKIPQSPDMDAMLEEYEDRAQYGKKAESIEQYLSYSVPA